MSQRLFEKKESVSPLRQLLNEHLNKYYTPENPLKITVMGGMADGIGDFIHIFDVYKFYKKQFDNPLIRFKLVSFVTPEFKTVETIYGDQFPKSLYAIKKEGFDEDKFIKSEFLISKQEDLEEEDDIHFVAGKIAEAIKMEDGIINVSFELTDLIAVAIILGKPANAYIQSLIEYVLGSEDKIRLYAAKKRITNGPPFLYDETHMGTHGKGKGIKVYDKINELSQKDEKEKPSIVDSISNKELLNNLTEGKPKDLYLKSHSIACGYMQVREDAERFILTAAASSNKDCVDIFVNTNLLFKSSKSSKKNAELLKKLSKAGVSSIVVMDNDGHITHRIPETESEHKDTEKTVRLINFSGTSESDKEKWIALSDCVAASGDSSLSELISSKKFPVFGHSYKGGRIQEAFIDELETRKPKPEELIQYLRLTSAGGADFPEICEYIKTHQDAITKQWQAVCDEIITNHNVVNYLPTLIDNVIIASIVRKGDPKELERLLTAVPEWKISDTNFVFLAISAQNTAFLELMKKKDPDRFYAQMQEKHPSQDRTPIEYAIKIGDTAMASKLLELVKDKLAPSKIAEFQGMILKKESEKASAPDRGTGIEPRA